jgi:hypothetical protein
LRREIVAPRLGVADLSVEIDDEQRHVPSKAMTQPWSVRLL